MIAATQNSDILAGVPRSEQQLLLRACLLAAPEAIEAWEEWSQRVDIDHLDPHSDLLLALLQHNLRPLGVEAPVMERLRGVHRFHWVRNQMRFRKLTTLLDAYGQQGIESLLLDRAALLPLYYRDYGLTTVLEIGLLVRQAAAGEAQRLARRGGWKSIGRLGGISAPWRGSRLFQDARGTRLQIFWKDPGRSRELHDKEIWQRAQKVDVEGRAVWARNATDQLLEICLGRNGPTAPPPIQWVADAFMILRERSTEIDWDEVTSAAQRLDALAFVTKRLEYLRDSLGAPIPPNVIERARRAL